MWKKDPPITQKKKNYEVNDDQCDHYILNIILKRIPMFGGFLFNLLFHLSNHKSTHTHDEMAKPVKFLST